MDDFATPERAGAPPSEGHGVVRRERMDAASRVAGALAHQLANYLGTMRTMIELLADKVGAAPEPAQDFEILRQTLEGATRFVDALRRVAHPRPLGIGTTDVNAVIREAEPLLRGLLRPGTSLALRLAPGVVEARADAPRLRDLTAELVRALGAELSGGGQLEIATAMRPEPGGDGPSATLAVRGAGRGLDAERAPRIFEPFVFDQSYDGGLRLPEVYATVVRSGGSIEAEWEPASGTTIRITLPPPVRVSGEQSAVP